MHDGRATPFTRDTALVLLFGAVLTLVGAMAFASDPARPALVSIAQARTAKIGATVHVSGVVTVPSGAFASSLSPGFAIQDDTGGIYIVDTSYTLNLGARVEVTGTRGEQHGLVNIQPTTVREIPGTGTVDPLPVKTGKVGEIEAGILVQVEGRITSMRDDRPYGYKIFIDDGSGEYQVFIDASTGLTATVAGYRAGDVIRVTGFAGQYGTTYEVMPRIASDLD